ncbi:MAG TPA: metallophosphoesterase [Thermoanaerobaculia bacterium]|nr:metallophosphoesterase [Thermoanaerobaculia bacterium]
MFRIAHVSDLHVLSHTGAQWRAMLFNKRITGYANLVLRRGRVHRREYLLAVLEAASKSADHVVMTGDITNLALESEYEDARSLLDAVAHRVEVTVVPGNHDIYLPAILHERRFSHHFGDFLKSDLPQLALDLPAGPFPCVKLRGPAAIIAVSSGVPRPPFIAAGFLGEKQLDALARVLAHPAVVQRTPVILVHHPPVDRRSRMAQLRDGLVDAAAFRRALAPLARGLVLFGHLHVRMRCSLQTRAGALDVIGSSGAALDHSDPSVRAGFNLYDIDDDGTIKAIGAQVLDALGSTFHYAAIAERTECT